MIQVRERGLLTFSPNEVGSLDLGIVTKTTFDWLLSLSFWGRNVPIFHQGGSQFLRLNSYVGILQSPTGEIIEILPKTQETIPSGNDLKNLRQLLQKMVIRALSLKPKESGKASLSTTNTPIHEWIFSQFLDELFSIYKYGLKHDYIRINEESRFIRGQLDLNKQLRKSPDKSTWFNISHDIYSPDRIENKLIKAALEFILKMTKTAENWRKANELAHYLTEIPSIENPKLHLPKWQHNRSMHQYEAIFPWCEIIIDNFNPSFQFGKKKGVSLLFSMDKLFEVYVGNSLKISVKKPNLLKTQTSIQFFVEHQPKNSLNKESWFQLKPDLLLISNDRKNVLDTKWKLLNLELNTAVDKYDLSQSDFYQLFAYGHKYLNGNGHMMLIYPVNQHFIEPLSVFSFTNQLHLWVVPFDLSSEKLIGGDWQNHFSIY